ncbi:MAG: T9SS type A sorting domain-containing protein [Bacteroidales bacterium]|nr:T9SS type A sorting domain-containing protein [Bacteroidales bacterium]
MNYKKIISIVLMAFISIQSISLSGQVITTDPALPTANDSVTITFDATQGNGGLEGYEGDVYAHTGVITDESSSSSDWKYVKTGWGENTPGTRLERIGKDLYELNITPTIRNYYGVPDDEQIVKMAFVFRSAEEVNGSYLEGKTATGGDIFADVYQPALAVTFQSPPEESLIVEMNDTIDVSVAASFADSVLLAVNEEVIKRVEGNTLEETLIAGEYGKFWVKAIAKNDTGMVADSFYYYVRQPVEYMARPEGVEDGINIMNDTTVVLSLYAPYKEYAFAIGDFSNWEVNNDVEMYRTPDTLRFWVELSGLDSDELYRFQYYIDGELKVSDPYSELILDPWNDQYISEETFPDMPEYPTDKGDGMVSTFQVNKDEYQWQVENFEPPAKTDLVIYELLIRDFVEKHNYQTLIDTLGYLKSMGVNAIELMPVNEFDGNISWGYNPAYYFAPDKYYGTENKLKEFIDVCHANGIAVILDMVLNHVTGNSTFAKLYWDGENNRPALNNPWLNPEPRHPFNVFNDFDHESEATKYLVDRVNDFWIEEYKVDGYRFDLSKGFTQVNYGDDVGEWSSYDQSRVDIWKRIADSIWSTDADSYIILEHFADNSEETELSNYGMMLWGNSNFNYNEATMGYNSGGNSDFSWLSYQERGWNDPHVVGYMESHDEERLMYKNLEFGNSADGYDITHLTTALERIELAANFFFTIPGPKMVWQFGELGYDISIEFNGRTGEKPIKWEYYDDWRRNFLYRIFSQLSALKTEYPVFKTTDYQLSLSGPMKRIKLNGDEMSVVILGNFDVVEGTIDPAFQHTGEWYEYYTRETLDVSDVNAGISLEPGEYRIYTDKELPNPNLNTSIDDPNPDNDRLKSMVFPNPSKGKMYFTFETDTRKHVSLTIFNMLGQPVTTLQSGIMNAGKHTISWNGKGKNGDNMKPGVYYYKLQAGETTEKGKFIIQ